jgi:hypothetical protein
MTNPKEFEEAKRIMDALVRMPPKPHEDMKLGRKRKPPTAKKTPTVSDKRKKD